MIDLEYKYYIMFNKNINFKNKYLKIKIKILLI